MSDDDRVASGPDGLGDDMLLARLREMFERVDPAPVWLVELAKLSYELRSIDVELAELVADSLVEGAGVGVRAADPAAAPRLLTFEGSALAVEVGVNTGPDGRVLHGQLVPSAAARIEIRQPGRQVNWVEADDLGRFGAEGLVEGPLSLVVHLPGGDVVASQWVVVN